MALEPIFARAATAARLLDMTTKQFEGLVEKGHLPPPREVGGEKRFDVDAICKAIRGDRIGGGGMEW